MINSLSRGRSAYGDLIPWTIAQQVSEHLTSVWPSACFMSMEQMDSYRNDEPRSGVRGDIARTAL